MGAVNVYRGIIDSIQYIGGCVELKARFLNENLCKVHITLTRKMKDVVTDEDQLAL